MQWFAEMVAESKQTARPGPPREFPLESTPTHDKPHALRFDSDSRLVSSTEPRAPRSTLSR